MVKKKGKDVVGVHKHFVETGAGMQEGMREADTQLQARKQHKDGHLEASNTRTSTLKRGQAPSSAAAPPTSTSTI